MTSLVGRLLPVGERSFGKYELIAKLATGGMAEIFLAKRKELTREQSEFVVIKRVLPHLAEEERFLEMFRDEARLASRIVHENVCRVYEAGSVAGTFFMAMEYLHGVPVSRLLLRAAREKIPTDLRIISAIICQVCDGLQYAHDLKSYDGRSLEVVHRDVSPPNIYVTAEGLTKLLDFGVAKARGASQRTRTGTVKGKNSYMSPEQIHGKELDRRSDVFSLGIVLWESICARRLFSRDTDFLTYKAITDDPIPLVTDHRPAVPDGIAHVVARALSRDRELRTSSAAQLSDELQAAMAELGGVASREELAAYIQTSFVRDLEGRMELLSSVKEHLSLGSNAEIRIVIDEIDEEDLEKGISLSIEEGAGADVSPVPAAAGRPSEEAEEGQADVSARTAKTAENAVSTAYRVEKTDLNRPRGPSMKMVGFAAAAVVLGLGITYIATRSGDGGAAKGSTSADPEPTRPLAVVVADAAVAAVEPPPPVDASPPDAQVDRRPGFLNVDSSPYATIYVDGKKIGVTPLFKIKLPPGKHRLKAVSATGDTKRRRIEIRPARTTNLGRLEWK